MTLKDPKKTLRKPKKTPKDPEKTKKIMIIELNFFENVETLVTRR